MFIQLGFHGSQSFKDFLLLLFNGFLLEGKVLDLFLEVGNIGWRCAGAKEAHDGQNAEFYVRFP